jgi:hypothetical protein
MTCEKCGVEITTKDVRRERMGHIELAVPCSHIWYLKGVPSKMATALDIPPKQLEEIVYYNAHICLNKGTSSTLMDKQFIDERRGRTEFIPVLKEILDKNFATEESRASYDYTIINDYVAALENPSNQSFDYFGMIPLISKYTGAEFGEGAEAVERLLKDLDANLDETIAGLRNDLKKDKGQKNLKTVNMIQPTLWEDEKGIHMFIRTNMGHIYRSDSKDGGMTWCKAYETPMGNPNSGIDVVKMDDGTLVLVMNPIFENWGDRAPLVLLASTDGGDTFEEIFKCEATEGDYEFSYPAMVAVGNTLHITYTHQREGIVYQRVEIE